jgi:hemerythrin
MKMRRATCFWLTLLAAVPFQHSSAQDASNIPCDQVHTIARMSLARSHAALAKEKHNAGRSYRAEMVYAARSFELQPSDRTTALLFLNLLPQDDAQHATLIALGDSLCDEESVAEMKSLSRLGERLARDFAKAALRAPEMLSKYVAYASTSVQDAHSDYAVQMQAVCRAKHAEFLRSVRELPSDKRDWFVKHVLDPDHCHAVALPEAQ